MHMPHILKRALIGITFAGVVVIILVILDVRYFGVDGGFTVPKTGQEPYACTMDAKICPDGSAVGRSGPNCEFAVCPGTIPDIATTIVAAVDQTKSISGVTITPLEVLSDSRCPTDVTCVWAGEIKIRLRAESEGTQQTIEIIEGQTVTFSPYQITLTNVDPSPHTKNPITQSAYRFTFEVEKEEDQNTLCGPSNIRCMEGYQPVCTTGTWSCSKNQTQPESNGVSCKENGGDWSAVYKECGGVDAKVCASIGGTFNECASACRHDPKAEVCTMQCVQVCEFK